MEVLSMARTTPRPSPTLTQTLQPLMRQCPCCGEPMWAAYHNYRTITTLEAIMRLTLQIRRCLNPEGEPHDGLQDRKSTRLNSSHRCISYAVFCLKKKKKKKRKKTYIISTTPHAHM